MIVAVCSDIMHLAAQSICEGFAAFLPARRSTLLEYAESFKARRPLPGAADTSVALTLWDALYVLATLSTTHFAVLTAALQYGAVRNVAREFRRTESGTTCNGGLL